MPQRYLFIGIQPGRGEPHTFIHTMVHNEQAGPQVQLSPAKSHVVKNLPNKAEPLRVDLSHGIGNFRLLGSPGAYRNIVSESV